MGKEKKFLTVKDKEETIECAMKVVDKIADLKSNQELMGKIRSLPKEDTHISNVPKNFDFPEALTSVCEVGLGKSLIECLEYTLNEEIRLGRRLTPDELKSVTHMFLEEHHQQQSVVNRHGNGEKK